MNYSLIRKGVVVFIILIFIGMSFVPSTGINIDTQFLKDNSMEILDDWDINISFDPMYPDGDNNWYVSCINLTIT